MAAADLIWPRNAVSPPVLQRDDSIVVTFRHLDEDAARQLSLRAVERLAHPQDSADARDAQGARDQCIELLFAVACFVPTALSGLHPRLLHADVLHNAPCGYAQDPHVLWYGADAQTRAAIIEGLGEGVEADPGSALSALAWVDDATVHALFRQWRVAPPSWAIGLWQPPHAFASMAGWSLSRSGDRRSLARGGCHLLEAGRRAEPVAVYGPHDGLCGWCGARLTTLFDLSLSDSRLAFLQRSGRRLTVATCLGCVCYGTVFMEVDDDGGCEWSPVNVRPDYLPEHGLEAAPALPCRLGRARRTPFEALAFGWYAGGQLSQLGGQPAWVQNADYPSCPRCGELMASLGQLEPAYFDDRQEGIIYAFHDPECGLAATVYQQT